MNYKETLFFVAKCLTINHEAHNKRIVEEMLQSKTVDWDEVVKLSTAHYVFPALYCNLKRASFLSYLPKELVEYMKYITNLNRERNEEIIAQAKELNTLLLEHNITPIFLKGTGNLLEGLYDDIAERMVGDIDVLIHENDIKVAHRLLNNNGNNINFSKSLHRHLPRIKDFNNISAIEIHRKLLIEKYTKEFNYDSVKNNLLKNNDTLLLCYEDQLVLSIATYHINDFGFDNKTLSLRNAYDVFLLSKKTNTKKIFSKFNALQHPLNCFLASCFEVFNKPQSLHYIPSRKVKKYLDLFNLHLENFHLAEENSKKAKIKRERNSRFQKLYKLFFQKEYRIWLYKSICDKNWQKEKLIQLGIRKP
jgi:hypothetical protein